MIPLCPESPRWLLVNGRRAEAIDALNYMARVNCTGCEIPAAASFVEDPTNYVVQRETSEAGDVTQGLIVRKLSMDVPSVQGRRLRASSLAEMGKNAFKWD
jgi:hypothetical protein